MELSLGQGKPPVEVAMPGAPAQVSALGDRVLVTVRDPGRGDRLIDTAP
jgi:hypothetical protein